MNRFFKWLSFWYLLGCLAACNTTQRLTSELLCHQKNANERYLCFKPLVTQRYDQYNMPTGVFQTSWTECPQLTACEIEKMVGNKCFVKVDDLDETAILKGHIRYSQSTALLDLDKFYNENKAYKVKSEEAILGNGAGYEGDRELQRQWFEAARKKSLLGYDDLTRPCVPKEQIFKNSKDEWYEIARDSKYGCGTENLRTAGVCTESEVFQELCTSGMEDFKYPVDCLSGYDVINGLPGREVYLKARICSYDPAKEYTLQLTHENIYTGKKTDIGGPVRIGYNANFTHIKKREPASRPDSPTTAVFTIQVFVNHPTHVPGDSKTATIKAFLKEKGASASLAVGHIEVADFYEYNGTKYKKREFNIYVASNPQAASSDIRTYSTHYGNFEKYFQKAYTDEAHVVGNFRTIYLPDYLIDAAGNAVLLEQDFRFVSDTVDFFIRWNNAVHQWRRRCLQYFYLSKNNQLAGTTLGSLLELYRKRRSYDNTAILSVVKTNKLYSYESGSNILKDVSFDFLFEQKSKTYYQLNLEYFTSGLQGEENSFVFGLTNGELQEDVFVPMSIIFLDPIHARYGSTATQTAIKVGLHELAHAWNFRGMIGSTGRPCDKHNEYVYGEGARRCMFQCPHNPESLYNMSFSKGIVQRLLKVMAITF